MKVFFKNGAVFFAIIFLFILFNSTCFASKYAEKGMQAIPLMTAGKITGVTINIKAATGGSKINVLQLNYPGSTVLITSVSLTAQKGSYKIELQEAGGPSLMLKSQKGKTVKGSARLSVSASGAVQYKVTAKRAKKVVINFSFSPVVKRDEHRISVASMPEKKSSEETGLSLKLTCTAGKNCILQAQNMSSSKAYQNILFRIDYKMMTREDSIGKCKSGRIEDAVLPGKAEEWPLDIVFGEPPKDIRVSFLKADTVDPSAIKAKTADQQKKVIPLFIFEEVEKK